MNLRNLAIWGAILVAAVVIYSVMQGQTRSGAAPTDIAYSEMISKIDSGDVAKADVSDPAIVVTDKSGREFRAFGPKDTMVLQQHLDAHKDIKTSFPPNSPNLLLDRKSVV